MKKNLAILFITVLFFSCERILPKPPQFCCKINGKQWVPTIKGALGGRNTGSAFYNLKQYYFSVYGNSESNYIAMTIKLNPNSELEINKKYNIELVLKEGSANGRLGVPSVSNPDKDVILTASSGYIVITKMDSQYFTGTFEYDFETKVSGKSYKVRKGQFNNMLYAKED